MGMPAHLMRLSFRGRPSPSVRDRVILRPRGPPGTGMFLLALGLVQVGLAAASICTHSCMEPRLVPASQVSMRCTVFAKLGCLQLGGDWQVDLLSRTCFLGRRPSPCMILQTDSSRFDQAVCAPWHLRGMRS